MAGFDLNASETPKYSQEDEMKLVVLQLKKESNMNLK